MSLVHPILEYGAACWDPYREGQISALDRVQKKAAKFAHHMNSPNWETGVAQKVITHMHPLQSVEGYRRQIITATLSEQGRP